MTKRVNSGESQCRRRTYAFGYVSLFVLMLIVSTVDATKKVKRVKAGMKYKDKDPVHVVVNKVGYVANFLTIRE